ncbi:ATP-binding protein, partial [Neobacillus drentensis]|uniref:ATP-binding protein n=1 Tax=Neobacillus drentensis TaxID=220684 RepID=UPI0030016F2D
GLREYLKTNGGIFVYRDGIRIYEYGEKGNDWLGLEAKRINSPSISLSSSIVIGAVYLDRKTSSGLEEKTNREGFVENQAFETFRNAIVFAIEKIERERAIDKELLRKYYGHTNKSEPVMAGIEDIKKKISKKITDDNLQKELYKCLDNIENDYKYISDVYIRSATSGLSLSIVVHELQKIISELEHAIKQEVASTHIKALINDLAKVTDGYASIIRNQKKTIGDLKDVLRNALFNVKYRLRVHKIDIIDDFSDYQGNSNVKCVENLILGTLMNLIDNSIWWTDYTKIPQKKIYLGISDDALEGYKSIVLADNGKGFTIPTEQVIKPFISDRPGGMGLGLHLANEVMNSHGGKLIFPDNGDLELPPEFQNGALVVLAFKEAIQ